MKLFSVVIACALLLNGCASLPPVDEMTEEQLRSNVAVSTSKFDSDIKLTGTVIANNSNGQSLISNETYYIASRVDKSDLTARHDIVIDLTYNQDWRYYQSISFEGGATRSVNVINREVQECTGNMFIGCIFNELVSVRFNRNELEEAADGEGLTFRLNSRFSNVFSIIHFPASYLKVQLQAVDTAIKELEVKDE